MSKKARTARGKDGPESPDFDAMFGEIVALIERARASAAAAGRLELWDRLAAEGDAEAPQPRAKLRTLRRRRGKVARQAKQAPKEQRRKSQRGKLT
jgi:hypothetical protein